MSTAPSNPTRSNRTRSEERRRQILETTLRLVAEGGVDSVTHRRVAAAAGVPLGSTTYYFESREHLLREAFRHFLERTRAAQSALAERFEDLDANGIVEYLVELTEREFADPNMIRAEYELTLFASRDAAIAEELHRWDDWMLSRLAVELESLGTERAFDAARTLLDLMRGYELERLTRRELDSEGLRRRLRVVVSALVPGCDLS